MAAARKEYDVVELGGGDGIEFFFYFLSHVGNVGKGIFVP